MGMRLKYTLFFIIVYLVLLICGCTNRAPVLTDGTAAEPSAAPADSSLQEITTAPADNNKQEIYSSEGIAHDPYGWDNLYGAKEVPEIWWGRAPRDPQEGEPVEIFSAIWQDTVDMDIWLEWTLNGAPMEPVSCRHASNLKDTDITKQKYVGELGKFVQGDKIEYYLCAGATGNIERKLGPYSFSAQKWEAVQRITDAYLLDNSVILETESKSLKPKLFLTFLREGTLRLSIDPQVEQDASESLLPVTLEQEDMGCTVSGGNLIARLGKEPYRFLLSDNSGNILMQDTEGDGLEILTDGEIVSGVRLNIKAPLQEGFYGFGMKYDSLNQRGKTVNTYCVNWYTDQAGETYTPVPYYFVPDKYGLYIDTTYYSKFEIDTVREEVCSIEISTGSNKNADVDLYLFSGSNAGIADGYTEVTGKPALPPVWAFGPWISANEWNKQSEVIEQLDQTLVNDIPTSVIVIEAWSDEESFYTFNDSVFNPQDGSFIPKLKDFTFGGRWPDPKSMIDKLHDNGIKVLLWQIPVLKSSESATPQSLNDQAYAQAKGYILKNEDGSTYRLPANTWFGNSMLLDFTNPEASEWFLSKRRYLLEELGIDGFKTDGGEFVWGRQVTAYDGTKGDELRNLYPDLYAQAYYDYSNSIAEDVITFSRAGGASMQKHPICWIGDQKSNRKAFEDALHATLSASMSGIPFVAWDVAGFSGDVPSSELYQRAVAQAAFSPMMQMHSETSGDPDPSQSRTPWNIAERKRNEACLDTYRYYADIRMNLMPYLYTEARYSSISGEPLMRSMPYAYPGNSNNSDYEFQYMLGENILVAPVTDISSKNTEFYLPDGSWYSLFDGKEYQVGEYTIECPLNEIPVFVREGTILPLNLNKAFELGGSIGNNLESYQNLTFRIYPGEGYYQWFDYVNQCEVEISTADGGKEVIINNLLTSASLEYMGKVDKIRVNGLEMEGEYNSISDKTYFQYDLKK